MAHIKIQVEFTDEEIQWLKDLMQNPIYEDETPKERQMRKSVFDGLKMWHDVKHGYYRLEEDDIPF